MLNATVDGDRWPVSGLLAEHYRALHPVDDAVLVHHSAFYRRFAPGELARTLEFGAGPNRYPLMLAGAASRRIEAVERSAGCLRYLDAQPRAGPDPRWLRIWARARQLNPDLPEDVGAALTRVTVVRGNALEVPSGRYDAASMTFVAESVTGDRAGFHRCCTAFADSVRPGGHLVAAFLENAAFTENTAGYPVDVDAVADAFAPGTAELAVTRVDADPARPDGGHTGIVLLAARRYG